MPLKQSTQRIIDLAVKLTDRPVHIAEDPSLQTLAKITIARGDAPMHILRYKPSGSIPPDYFIAYQCGFVIRLYMAPSEKRFDVGWNSEGNRRMDEALSELRIPGEMRGMGKHLLNGLITQLRMYPVGLRIDQWLFESYPDLRELQKTGAHVQLEQNIEAIKMANSAMFPRKIVDANLSMNAAFAMFWSKRWNDPSLILPFKAAGLLEGGMRLLAISEKISEDSASDMDLIDEWAFELGLNGWYDRIPYKLNP